MQLPSPIRVMFLMLSAVAVTSCSGAGNDSLPSTANQKADGTVIAWDTALLQAVRETKPPPTVVSRSLAVMHTAMYDAWVAYDPVAIGTLNGARYRRPFYESTLVNKRTAVSYAAYRVLVDLFPANKPEFDALMQQLHFDPNNTSTDAATAVGIGNAASAAVISYRHADGSNQLGDLAPGPYSDYTGYTPVNTPTQVNDPNHWQPLSIPQLDGSTRTQKFSTPHWYRVKPFALTSAAQFRPPPPPQFGSAEFTRQTQQIVDYSAHLNDTQKVMAEYWADGPHSELPPGHWCLFANFVATRDHHSLDQDVKMLFALSNAELDAGIAVWDAKRAYDYTRPITAVHTVFDGQMINAWGGPFKGIRRIRAQDWQPYQPPSVVTPPFPEYVSGHSAFSAAGAEILKDFTGSDALNATYTVPAGGSIIEPGATPAHTVVLSWPTFSAAADEAAASRRYGGIHFESGDIISRRIGRQIAALVWEKAQRLFLGKARY